MNDSHVTDGFAPELLTVPEAARLLRISRNLAYELVARREIPSIRLGRVIRIPRPTLDEWIVGQANPTSPDVASNVGFPQEPSGERPDAREGGQQAGPRLSPRHLRQRSGRTGNIV